MAEQEDRRRISVRLVALQTGVVAVFAFLALAFWYLQVVRYEHFRELAENNHQRTLALRAPRGVVYDRDGRVLVENRDSFSISILREHTKDIEHTIAQLARATGVDEAFVREAVRRQAGQPRYRPILVIEDATLAQVAAVMARRHDSELPDVLVERVPARKYPVGSLGAHLFGYVGEATEGQLTEDVRSGDIIGQAGIERVYNDLLKGTDGAKRVVVNSMGREIRPIEEIQPVEGRRIKLTIDYHLQVAAEEAFRAFGYNGAAVILDPRNGEVLAFLSLPAYDPNAFAAGIDRATWQALNTDRLLPLQNRAIQGRYSPGSVFKIAVAVAALQERVATPSFRVSCGGGASFYGRFFKCWQAGGHGSMDMYHAIEQSCNTYFYTLGNMVGIDRINKWATALGLGVKSGIDLPGEAEGLVPSSAWKKERTGERWYPGETISVAIGQGQVWVTPVSLAVMIATVANGGTRYTPHLVKEVNDGKGWKPYPAPAPQPIGLKPETVETLRQGLWLVVNGAGTGGRARIPGREVAGKTGTAQVISNQGKQAAGQTNRDLRDHGWFVFFAPRDNPEIAGVVFVEHAEHGYLGAPIAKHVMETYFAKKDGLPLPAFPTPAAPVRVIADAGARAAARQD
ncbi:MAG: penicillin-binding protein 2 [Vicinamibacterales bacterium]